MASTNAAKTRAVLFTAVDTDSEILSLVNLVLDCQAAGGSNGVDPNPYRDCLQSLTALATPNSARALTVLAELLNSAINGSK